MAINWQQALPTALVMGNDRQTLAVIRSLARAGYKIILVSTDEASPAAYSRFVAETWFLDGSQSVAALAKKLGEYIEARPDISVVFPVAEREMECLFEADLPASVHVASVSPETVALCHDKARMLARAGELGVPVAIWKNAFDVASLHDAVNEIGFPLVLKPVVNSESLIGFKAWICQSHSDPMPLLLDFPREGVIVQKHAGGLRRNVMFVASRGKVLGLGEVKVIRTDRQNGTGLGVEGVTVPGTPVLAQHTATLVASLAYTGVGCAQFLLDESTGEACFLEINARLDANSAAVCRSGMDLPRCFVDVVRNLEPDVGSLKPGRRYAWLGGDINGLLNERRNLSALLTLRWLCRMVVAQWRAADHVTWEWRDPRPTLVMHGRRALQMLKRMVKRPA